jgi:hypothetical protein
MSAVAVAKLLVVRLPEELFIVAFGTTILVRVGFTDPDVIKRLLIVAAVVLITLEPKLRVSVLIASVERAVT